MALRLQLEDGTIKEYRTWYAVNRGEHVPLTYKTKCGIRWDREPGKSDGCSHIDCAIRSLGGSVIPVILVAAYLIGLAIFGLPPAFKEGGFVFVIMAVLSMGCVAWALWMISGIYGDEKVKRELYEFRDHGTVHGIKAQMIEDDSTLNEMGSIEIDSRRSSKPTLLNLAFPIVFLTLGVVWFFSVTLIMTDIGGLMGYEAECIGAST